ncbi:MAG: hypothetical protein AVDCRST_MAG77-255 [uncultured Chloroflexi bacterium]|uniref:Uncharacterized protein n=1 Tax=uncultured Chloroflexota bacterium TaxID=166587 RepID=A0A6J4H8G3_9CHLR|nr:MAG: hypothetical protein AVDCRST_MAG77-255 [uncultured Chloroflexota bacterium]
MKKRLFALSAALTLTTALSGTTFAGDPSQWGAASASRKVNEYEGQHRASGVPTTAGKDPEVPVSPNLAKKGSFDITERQGSDQLSIAAGGTSKGGEVPVTPGIATGGGQGKVSVQD